MMDGNVGSGQSENMQGQILIELGKLSTAVAVIDERTKPLAELASRIREIESLIPPKLDERVRNLETASSTVQGGRDNQARIVSWIAAGAAAASGIANYLHR